MFIRVLSIIAVIAIALSGSSFADDNLNLENWKIYTSLSDVRCADVDSKGRIWAGAYGGIYIYDDSDKSYREIKNTEGLISLKITSLVSHNDKIYIGTSDGYLQIVDDKFHWTYIGDIAGSDYPDRSISKILIHNNYVYLAGGFGVAKFSPEDGVFLESTVRLGEFSSSAKVNDLTIVNDTLWAATNSGLACVSVNSSIANPNNWKTFTQFDSLSDESIYRLASLDDVVFFSTEMSVTSYLNGEFDLRKTIDNGRITGLIEKNGEIIYSDLFQVYRLNDGPIIVDYYWKKINDIVSINKNGKDEILLLYLDYGLSRLLPSGDNPAIMPNTPLTNNFMDIDVDSRGFLWAATKSNADDGKGFMALTPKGEWINFNSEYDSLIHRNIAKINAVGDDIYASAWGSGLIVGEYSEGDFNINRYDTSNSPMTGAINSAPGLVITGEVVKDHNGGVWTINYGEGASGPLLVKINDDDSFTTFNNPVNENQRQFFELAIDQWGTKWLGSNHFSQGLFYYNDNNTPEDKGDDKYGLLNSVSSGLLDNEQTDVEVDKNGFVWIATKEGLNFIYDPSPILSGGDVIVREDRNFSGQTIYDIYVDPLDNKWIATSDGVWVLSPDGSETLNEDILNSNNTPLTEDAVYSITSDPNTGDFYFGTKFGLIRAKSSFVRPTNKFSLDCYPQPFNPYKDEKLYIDGLEPNSDVRVLTLDGDLVKDFSTNSRIVSWDGRDKNGSIVSSGVYIVSATSLTTENAAVAKIAVVVK